MSPAQGLSKKERIKSRKQMDKLFSGGSHAMTTFPMRVVYRFVDREEGEPHGQMLVSVSKKYFKAAVKRNMVKRRIREAYRKNKHLLDPCWTEKPSRGVDMAFIWICGDIVETAMVEKTVAGLMARMVEKELKK